MMSDLGGRSQNKVYFLLFCPSEKWWNWMIFAVKKCGRHVACEKQVINLRLWLWGKRIVHNLCSCSLLPLDLIDSGPAAGLLKGRRSGETMVTEKQWGVLVLNTCIQVCAVNVLSYILLLYTTSHKTGLLLFKCLWWHMWHINKGFSIYL